MALLVVNGATLMCSFGAAPSRLVVIPANRVNASNVPVVNIMGSKPMMNIQPFGVCSSLANPQVAQQPRQPRVSSRRSRAFR